MQNRLCWLETCRTLMVTSPAGAPAAPPLSSAVPGVACLERAGLLLFCGSMLPAVQPCTQELLHSCFCGCRDTWGRLVAPLTSRQVRSRLPGS